MKLLLKYPRTGKRTIVFLMCMCLYCCTQEKSKNFDEKVIEKMANESIKLPSVFSSILFFGKCSDGKVAIMYIQDLRAVHAAKYKGMSYLEFLKQTLNQKISVEYQDKIECFDLSKDVTNFYETANFNMFLNSYTEKLSGGRLALKSSVPEVQVNSILYYLLRNNYFASYDDNMGKYYIYPIDSIMNKQ